MAPPNSTAPGIRILLSEVEKIRRVICGTASPINATGPAKDVTRPASPQEQNRIKIRNSFILTPMEEAYSSPRRKAFKGLLNPKAKISSIPPAKIIILSSDPLNPEKLPSCHRVKPLTFSASAKAIITLVTAWQRYPIIKPAMSKVTPLFTLEAMLIIISIAPPAPIKAARVTRNGFNPGIPSPRAVSITSDTIRVAPDDIPRIKGPTIGLRKKTWSSNPATAR